ncbi:MAG: hypothetical protein ACNA7Y_02735, partial [Gammaproteobacteria bacterium]
MSILEIAACHFFRAANWSELAPKYYKKIINSSKNAFEVGYRFHMVGFTWFQYSVKVQYIFKSGIYDIL